MSRYVECDRCGNTVLLGNPWSRAERERWVIDVHDNRDFCSEECHVAAGLASARRDTMEDI